MAKKKSTAERNKAFWKLPAPKQRVAVAKDVLKQLAAKFYKAKRGDYFVFSGLKKDINTPPKGLDTLFADLKKGGASCEVCGIGSVFASMTILGNKSNCSEFSLEQIHDGRSMSDSTMRHKLNKVFSEKDRVLIEAAFEKDGELAKDNEGCFEIPENLDKAVEFGKKYKSDSGRLKAIMNNIIKNKGEFIP